MMLQSGFWDYLQDQSVDTHSSCAIFLIAFSQAGKQLSTKSPAPV